jgi:transglutaminase-like putative cysteine protease
MVRPDASARRGAFSTGPLPVERFFQFSLLGLVASGYLAVAGSASLDVPTIILTGTGILLRALLLSGVVRLNLTERAATLVAVGYAGFFPIDYFFLSHDFLSSTVHLVFFLAVVKILTAKTNRDNLYIAIIAFLELLAAAILSIDFNFFLCLALFLLFAIAALTSGEIRRSMHKATTTARSGLKHFHSRLALLGGWIALGILALTAGMFFLLPRTADAALSRLISHRIRMPGYSDQVTLGDIGEFKNSSRPVMHIAIYGNQPMGAAKWRGDALTDFNGRAWSTSNLDASADDRPFARLVRYKAIGGHVSLGTHAGPQRSYRVEFTDLESRTLFFAGTPEIVEGLPAGTIEDVETGCFRLRQSAPSGFRYEVASVLEEPPETAPPLNLPPILNLNRREVYTQLPQDTDPRIPLLAKSLTASATTDLGRARALEQGLLRDYGYTLELPQRQQKDPLADFLFTRRKGHCEYFASAMAVMLRTLKIPSRLATGFQNGVYNPISDLWLVRASDAHSWVEAWIPGHGWTTFDPTPPDLSPHPLTLFSKAGLYLDAAETFWQQWVVGYDPNHQGTLADRVEQMARRLGMGWFDSLSGAESQWVTEAKSWTRRFGLGTLLGLLAAYWIWSSGPRWWRALRVNRRVERVRRGQANVADATLLYDRMLQVLRRQGYQKPVWFTPVEFARSLPATQLGHTVEEFTGVYNALRFGGRTEAAPRLSTLLDELERPGRRP